jgi:hypothetical protein
MVAKSKRRSVVNLKTLKQPTVLHSFLDNKEVLIASGVPLVHNISHDHQEKARLHDCRHTNA